MERVPRELFVPLQVRRHAYDDAALELSHGQTISQPYIVGLISASLRLAGGERVLDVGTGSGYQAAVLAELAGNVVSVERIPALAEQARRNLDAAGYGGRVEVVVGDGTLGLPERAPFDAIAVAAAAAELPPALEDQLAPGARLVIPIGQSLVCVERTVEGGRRVRVARTRALRAARRRGLPADALLASPRCRSQPSPAARHVLCADLTTGSSSHSSARSARAGTSSTCSSSRRCSAGALMSPRRSRSSSRRRATTGGTGTGRSPTRRATSERKGCGSSSSRSWHSGSTSSGSSCSSTGWTGAKVVSQAIAIVLVTPLNFLGNKLWSFRT